MKVSRGLLMLTRKVTRVIITSYGSRNPDESQIRSSFLAEFLDSFLKSYIQIFENYLWKNPTLLLCNFTWNQLIHRYLSRILLKLYEVSHYTLQIWEDLSSKNFKEFLLRGGLLARKEATRLLVTFRSNQELYAVINIRLMRLPPLKLPKWLWGSQVAVNGALQHLLMTFSS